MYRLALFSVASQILAYLSRRSLKERRGHGYYRFFAFEAILALVLLNAPRWYRRPLAPRQILSWTLLFASAFLAAHGFHLLRAVGRPTDGFEATTHLVRVGAYRYLRHPLYASLLWLSWGAFLKGPSLLGALLASLASACLLRTAQAEEAEMLEKFGPEYEEYMRGTRRFVPWVF